MRFLASLILSVSVVHGGSTAQSGPWRALRSCFPEDVLTNERLTGDWAGWRESVSGLSLDLCYTADWSAVVSGGVDRRSTFRGLTCVSLGYDLEEATRWRGASLFLDAYHRGGRDASADVGDVQGTSNIDADTLSQVGELWFEQKLLDDRVRLKIGKIDANSEFGSVASAAGFLHGSPGLSPTVIGMPTYPDPAFGMNVSFESEGSYAGFGIYDGAGADGVRTGRRGPSTFFRDHRSDGYFGIAESGLRNDRSHIGVGVWHHTSDFERFDGGFDSGTEGLYLIGEHALWRERSGVEEDDQGLTVFGTVGAANGDVAEVERHYLLGLSYRGLIPGRDADVVGLMVSHADLSDHPSSGFVRDETAVELFYQAQLLPSLSWTADLQFISDPSGSASVDDAVVAGLRIKISL